jgi:DNA replication licensing factor MCM2
VTPAFRTSQVMLESFLQAQKVSVRKSLQRSFRKYLTYGEASNQLLMHKLQGLIVEVDKYKLVRIRCSFTVTMARV